MTHHPRAHGAMPGASDAMQALCLCLEAGSAYGLDGWHQACAALSMPYLLEDTPRYTTDISSVRTFQKVLPYAVDAQDTRAILAQLVPTSACVDTTAQATFSYLYSLALTHASVGTYAREVFRLVRKELQAGDVDDTRRFGTNLAPIRRGTWHQYLVVSVAFTVQLLADAGYSLDAALSDYTFSQEAWDSAQAMQAAQEERKRQARQERRAHHKLDGALAACDVFLLRRIIALRDVTPGARLPQDGIRRIEALSGHIMRPRRTHGARRRK